MVTRVLDSLYISSGATEMLAETFASHQCYYSHSENILTTSHHTADISKLNNFHDGLLCWLRVRDVSRGAEGLSKGYHNIISVIRPLSVWLLAHHHNLKINLNHFRKYFYIYKYFSSNCPCLRRTHSPGPELAPVSRSCRHLRVLR